MSGIFKATPCLTILLLLALAACGADRSGERYTRQLGACSVAEGNGLLDAATEACRAALAIARREGYSAEAIASLEYRVGRLERQRGNFAQAEPLLRRSLAAAESNGDPTATALRLLELAMVQAGQDQWLEGMQSLERAAPLLAGLEGDGRRTAANVYRGFGTRLAMQGHAEQAERCERIAGELTAR